MDPLVNHVYRRLVVPFILHPANLALVRAVLAAFSAKNSELFFRHEAPRITFS